MHYTSFVHSLHDSRQRLNEMADESEVLGTIVILISYVFNDLKFSNDLPILFDEISLKRKTIVLTVRGI